MRTERQDAVNIMKTHHQFHRNANNSLSFIHHPKTCCYTVFSSALSVHPPYLPFPSPHDPSHFFSIEEAAAGRRRRKRRLRIEPPLNAIRPPPHLPYFLDRRFTVLDFFRLTRRSKGYGFVRFADEGEQTRAMTEMQGGFEVE
ncbi:unnamed protein product [Vicia faba]|uniref:RRM domain-containing protein n=1 Tax=Vicia faba TaxID=3906 RepID=A0AAV1B8R4_VICFA|nr:unnamed protein product [Vicia faba]